MDEFKNEWAHSRIFLTLLVMTCVHAQSFSEMHLEFAIPDSAITNYRTDNASYCGCKVWCFTGPTCRAVTIYRFNEHMECKFSTRDVRAGNLIVNTSAVTLFMANTGYSCPPPFILIQGIGCLSFVGQKMLYAEAKAYCQTTYSAELFVADTPTHFLRLFNKNFFDYLQQTGNSADTQIYVGIENDIWLDGRAPDPNLEWGSGEPNSVLETRGAVSTVNWKLNDVSDAILVEKRRPFLCEKKMWKA